jgi:putative transposase
VGRPHRDYHPHSIYHLTAHGVDDRPICVDDEDRQGFAIRLLRVATAEGWGLHAACLLDTHFHLIVEPRGGSIPNGMRLLNGGHSRAFNKRHERRGALFESRYEDREIRDEEHLENAIVYVEFNAVSAGIVESVEDWPWSTHARCPMHRLLSKCLSTGVRHRHRV